MYTSWFTLLGLKVNYAMFGKRGLKLWVKLGNSMGPSQLLQNPLVGSRVEWGIGRQFVLLGFLGIFTHKFVCHHHDGMYPNLVLRFDSTILRFSMMWNLTEVKLGSNPQKHDPTHQNRVWWNPGEPLVLHPTSPGKVDGYMCYSWSVAWPLYLGIANPPKKIKN